MRERTFLLDRNKTTTIRETRGLQSRIARELGVSRNRVFYWLLGENAVTETYLSKICRVTGHLPSDLMTEEAQKFLTDLSIFA